jgi:hypothetical protein
MTDEAVKKVSPEPNLLGRDDVRKPGLWKIGETQPVRGFPVTSIDRKEMLVPLTETERARCIRAHEMIHAKISPTTDDFRGWVSRGTATEKAMIVAEESRVNYLAAAIGFPMREHMEDGRELLDAVDLTTSGDWKTLVWGTVAGVFTASEQKWIEGATRVNPNWGTQIANIVKYVNEFWDVKLSDASNRISALADIDNLSHNLDEDQLEINRKILAGEKVGERDRFESCNHGFYRTEELAQWIDHVANIGGEAVSIMDSKSNLADAMERAREADGGLCNEPLWDTLRFAPAKPMRPILGAVSRKRTATNMGRYPRRVERLLSDPERRIFDTVKKADGGVVLIDGSGSMDFSADDIEKMMLAAPGCTVAVYSAPDTPRYYGTTELCEHTMFILAQDGKMLTTDQVKDVQGELVGGNGCDLPALKWAIARRKNRHAPIVWVTDGFVHGNWNEVLRCVTTAQRANVMYANDCYAAVRLLRKLKTRRKVVTKLPRGMSNVVNTIFKGDARKVFDPTIE